MTERAGDMLSSISTGKSYAHPLSVSVVFDDLHFSMKNDRISAKAYTSISVILIKVLGSFSSLAHQHFQTSKLMLPFKLHNCAFISILLQQSRFEVLAGQYVLVRRKCVVAEQYGCVLYHKKTNIYLKLAVFNVF